LMVVAIESLAWRVSMHPRVSDAVRSAGATLVRDDGFVEQATATRSAATIGGEDRRRTRSA
jgi:hypothetical protein